jgi:peptide/nickel transport system substrate-binding protein
MARLFIKSSIVILFVFIIAGCTSPDFATPTVEIPTVQPSITPIPPTPTALPRNLTVCVGQEPSSLFIYNGSYSQSMWSILEAIYDGPVDYVNYEYKPVLLEKMPNLADGDASLIPVDVKQGMEIIDADGNLMTLQKGIKVFPSGCSAADCVVEYDGNAEIQMDQLVVKFKIKPGITWSDGTPLTAQDSVYSYTLAASPQVPVSKGIIRRTVSYTATDELTVEWKGLPGYIDQQYATRFWLPLPQHVMANKDITTLAMDPEVAEKPIGWGPFVITDWARGDHITLKKNVAYFRASEGLPKMDMLTIRFLGNNPEQSLQALLNGECDVLDQSTMLDDQLTAMLELKRAGKLNTIVGLSQFTEQLIVGITPASYDDGYNVAAGDRPDIFGDKNVRLAMAMCINREAITNDLLGGYSAVPASFLPVGDPLNDPQLLPTVYDPEGGAALLEQTGWREHDQDPSTPRLAFTVRNVYAGAPLEVNYMTTNAVLRKKVSEMVSADLQKCGFKVNLSYLSPEELFAAGPTGKTFGRSFDLAQFYWDIGSAANCSLYESSQIPAVTNNWIGSNVNGYSSEEFDLACQTSRSALPGQPDYFAIQQAPLGIFNTDLPSIPLYQKLEIGAARMDMCGFNMDPTTRSDLWNIELMDYGPACQ